LTARMNEFDQPIGVALPDWRPVPLPPYTPMNGAYCRVEPIDYVRHAEGLFAAYREDKDGRNWTYLPDQPVADRAAFDAWMDTRCRSRDPMFHAIVDPDNGAAAGIAGLMRIDPRVGSIEVGGINFAPRLQRTRLASEAMYLMMRRVFDELGYRRYEWKCDALNAPSRRAATRLGFSYEGLFRQATIYKGRNRDTAWYAILDSEWPGIKAGFEAWLDPANFDEAGAQRAGLGDLIAQMRAPTGQQEA